jgi:hypothetical protein
MAAQSEGENEYPSHSFPNGMMSWKDDQIFGFHEYEAQLKVPPGDKWRAK